MSGNYYIKVPKQIIFEFNGDFTLALWYATLIDYSKRFKPDELGFTRIAVKSILEDLGITERTKVWRLNKKLVERGYIAVDKVARGGRRFMGFKILRKML